MGLRWKVATGDALTVLRSMHDRQAHCCVTSPPYFGLRDYGTAKWEGGDPACPHQHETRHQAQGGNSQRQGRSNVEAQRNENFRDVCGNCGAVRVDPQIGLEKTPEEYVAKLVAIFHEVRRVLHDDGVLWLNLGDSYARDAGKGQHKPGDSGKQAYVYDAGGGRASAQVDLLAAGMKPKDLIGIPWMVAFALRADGWYLRSDVIWEKPNPMPESVTDRPTKSHEYIFLLSKSESYYYDRYAILEPFADKRMGRDGGKRGRIRNVGGRTDGLTNPSGIDPSANGGRNRRTVWRINAKPFPFKDVQHFAVFPPELPGLCIAAGSSEKCCGKCYKPFERLIERVKPLEVAPSEIDRFGTGEAGVHRKVGQAYQDFLEANPPKTVGWKPSCGCNAAPVPSVVLDPFSGSGTTGEVALRMGREFFGIELSPKYVELAEGRIRDSLVTTAAASALGDAVHANGTATDVERLPGSKVPDLRLGEVPIRDVGVGAGEHAANSGPVPAGQGTPSGIYLGNDTAGGSGHVQSLPPQDGVVK